MTRKRHSSIIAALASAILLFTSALTVAQNKGAQNTGKPATNKKSSSAPFDPAAEGEKRFRTNCGRCHKAPESISPRISKSILQHMRVRAMLTQEDEELILKYIAP